MGVAGLDQWLQYFFHEIVVILEYSLSIIEFEVAIGGGVELALEGFGIVRLEVDHCEIFVGEFEIHEQLVVDYAALVGDYYHREMSSPFHSVVYSQHQVVEKLKLLGAASDLELQ